MKKFERLERLIGTINVCKLSKSTIAIVGCGGVGGYVIEALARSNVGNLILIDYDEVTPSNCNRQLIATDMTIGKKKVNCWKERINSINPSCQVTAIKDKLSEENIKDIIPTTTDFIIDACDDINAKLAIINYSLQNKIPCISSMGTGNRLDPSYLKITTLDKTYNDPLAKVMRQKVKQAKINGKIMVCTSTELPIKTKDKVIASCSFVPGGAGLLIASYVIRNIIK